MLKTNRPMNQEIEIPLSPFVSVVLGFGEPTYPDLIVGYVKTFLGKIPVLKLVHVGEGQYECMGCPHTPKCSISIDTIMESEQEYEGFYNDELKQPVRKAKMYFCFSTEDLTFSQIEETDENRIQMDLLVEDTLNNGDETIKAFLTVEERDQWVAEHETLSLAEIQYEMENALQSIPTLPERELVNGHFTRLFNNLEKLVHAGDTTKSREQKLLGPAKN